jgi:hypothetical protein
LTPIRPFSHKTWSMQSCARMCGHPA